MAEPILERYLRSFAQEQQRLTSLVLPEVPADVGLADVYLPPRIRTGVDARTIQERPSDIDKESSTTPLRRASERRSVEQVHRPLYEVLRAHSTLALVAPMGYGKSLALQHLGALLAGPDTGRTLGLGAATIPILVRLRDVPPRAGSLVDLALESARRNLDARQGEALKSALEPRWDRGQVVLLLDGLDELTWDPNWLVAELIRRENRPTRVVLTSRPRALEDARIPGVHVGTIEDLAPTEVPAFIERWVRAAIRASAMSLDAADHAARLSESLLTRPSIAQMTSSPLAVTLIALLSVEENGLPIDDNLTETKLLKRYLRAVIKWEERKGRAGLAGIGEAALLRALGLIGLIAIDAIRRADDTLASPDRVLTRLAATESPDGMPFAQRSDGALAFWLRTGLVTESHGLSPTIRLSHHVFLCFAAALGLSSVHPQVRRDLVDSLMTTHQEMAASVLGYLGGLLSG